MASREELLRALEDRFILGEISEQAYKELKVSVLARGEGGSGAYLTDPTEYSVPPVHLDLPAGKIFQDRFVLVERLGAGGFGAVYLAEDRERGQKVALKVACCAPAQSRLATEQLRQELRVRDQITDYGHVIQTYDIHPADHEGWPLILMAVEHAELGSLRKWLMQNRHDEARRRTQGVEFFKQACLGVQAIHGAGLVHLDLKPENLLLCQGKDDQPVVKVSDLAISRSVEHFSLNPASVTRAGLGTPEYMSPEQFMAPRPKDVRFPSDIYSLGVVLFEILDGDPPFHGTPQELRERHVSAEPPQLSDVDDSLANAVIRCLAKKPDDRFRDVQQMLSTLAEGIPPLPPLEGCTSAYTFVGLVAICPVCGKTYHISRLQCKTGPENVKIGNVRWLACASISHAH
ncbi:MAG: serine/threonine-protein kinase, partial [Phycisphaerae bacterium]